MTRIASLDSLVARIDRQEKDARRISGRGDLKTSVQSFQSCEIEDVTDVVGRVNDEGGRDTVSTPGVTEELRRHVAELRAKVNDGVIAAEDDDDEDVGGALSSRAGRQRLENERVEYSDGSVYEGEVVVLGSGKVVRHGQGTYRDASQNATYTGQFRDDVVEGRAKAVMGDGSEYEGAWVGGNPEGQGRARYPNGGTYDGAFVAGGRSGWGVMRFEGGEAYQGEWMGDKIHGRGRWTHVDGSYYQGTFEGGSRVQGKLMSKDGKETYYDGAWRGMVRDGQGRGKVYVCCEGGDDGDGGDGGKGGDVRVLVGTYEGAWRDDVQDGEGEMRYVDGSVYVGSFAGGKRHGQGTMRFGGAGKDASDVYAGEWRDDAMHGKGYMERDGDKYVGLFEKGRPHGHGTMRFACGDAYEGRFEDGRPHGEGAMRYVDGSVYRGEFVKGRRHGQGKCKFEDGTTFKGAWDDDGWVQTEADPGRSRVAGAGIVRAQAGVVARFMIQGIDVIGNKRLNGGDDFQVVLVRHDGDDPADTVSTDTRDLEDGTYEATYVTNTAGIYELSVLCRGAHVADSPYPVRVLPGPAEFAKTLVTGVETRLTVGKATTFEIHACDRFGNRCTSGFDLSSSSSSDTSSGPVPRLEVQLDGAEDGTHHLEVVQAGDGRIMVRLVIERAGRHTLSVRVGGRPAPGTPFSIECREGDGDEGDDSSGVDSNARLVRSKWDAFVLADDDWDGEDAGDGRATGSDSGDREGGGTGATPIVENLEDLWLVSKLQQERKAKEAREKQARVEAMKRGLEARFGPATELSPEEAEQIRKQLVIDEETRVRAEIGEKVCEGAGKREEVRKKKESMSRAAKALDDL